MVASFSKKTGGSTYSFFNIIINGLGKARFEGVLIEAYKGTRRKHNNNIMKFRQIGHTTSHYDQSFFPKTISAGNRLGFAETPSLAEFRSKLNQISV